MSRKLTLPRRFPHASCKVRGFPTLRVLPAGPTSTVTSASLWMVLSVRILGRATTRPRPPWISQIPGCFSLHPCRALGPRRSLRQSSPYRLPTIAFQVFDLVGLRSNYHEAQSLHLHYGPDAALSTLSPCRYLHKPKTRFPVRRLIPLSGTGVSPARSTRLCLAHRRNPEDQSSEAT